MLLAIWEEEKAEEAFPVAPRGTQMVRSRARTRGLSRAVTGGGRHVIQDHLRVLMVVQGSAYLRLRRPGAARASAYADDASEAMPAAILARIAALHLAACNLGQRRVHDQTTVDFQPKTS